MEESPIESQDHEQEEHGLNGLLSNWRSCLLLSVMLLGLLATPLAVVFRWSRQKAANELTTVARQDRTAGQIAFITQEGQLATMNPDGSNIRPLTKVENGLKFPTWAPNGKHIAVTGSGKLLLVDPEPETVSQEDIPGLYMNASEPPFYTYWSPDSESIGFLTSQAAGIALHVTEVDDVESADSPIAEGEPFYWDWEPTAGGLLIHSGGAGAEARLAMIELNGTMKDADFGAPGFFQAPGISRSGRYSAYAALDDNGRSRLVIRNIDGEQKQYEAHVGQLSLAWSPTSEMLAYRSPRLSTRLGGGPLRKLDPIVGESVLLSNQNVLAFFWSPDGRTIAYFSLPQNEDDSVRIASVSGKETHRARTGRQQIEILLDLWVVDVASGHQRRLVQFTPTPIFMRQFLPFSDQYALSHRIWSPNSDAIVIPVLDDGRSLIAVVPVTRGSVQVVAEGQMGFWSHQ